MAYTATTATHKLLNLKKRVRAVAGGTSAGKTIAILQILIDDALTDTVPTLTSVVSESFPHLRKGAMRDFLNILEQHGYFTKGDWSKSEFTFTFPLIDQKTHKVISPNGSKIEFFSADQPSKVRGPRRDRLFVNEANNVPREAWEQLLLRTREYAFADWNPVATFYMYDDYELHDTGSIGSGDEDTDFVILTYKDNESLEPAIVKEIEKRRGNKAWFKVYGEGIRGELEQKIFKDWRIIDDIPHEASLEVSGMDFGYALDPTALVDIYYYNGGYILDEQIYRTQLKDNDAANMIMNSANPNKLIIADSADRQKIDMLYGMGLNIIGVEKRGVGGDTFTNAAISFVQNQRISITKRSTNLIKSYRNFMWQTDRDGNIIPKYDHYMSDGMMAVVYGMTNFDAQRHEEAYQKPKREKRYDEITGRVLT